LGKRIVPSLGFPSREDFRELVMMESVFVLVLENMEESCGEEEEGDP